MSVWYLDFDMLDAYSTIRVLTSNRFQVDGVSETCVRRVCQMSGNVPKSCIVVNDCFQSS